MLQPAPRSTLFPYTTLFRSSAESDSSTPWIPRLPMGCAPRRTEVTTVRAVPSRNMVPSVARSEEHTSELQSHVNLVCRLLLEKKKQISHISPVLCNCRLRWL